MLLSDTIEGITSVRAFNKQKSLQAEMHQLLDRNYSTSFLLSSVSTSFGFLLDVICLFFVAILVVVFITYAEHFTSEKVGLAVTQAMSITSTMSDQKAIKSHALFSFVTVVRQAVSRDGKSDDQFWKSDGIY